MLVDTHAHLYWDFYKDDLDEVLDRAIQARVTEIVNIGIDPKTSQIAAELASPKIKFYSSIGIHPHKAIKYSDHNSDTGSDVSIHQDLDKLEKIYKSNPRKVVAVGECGLDFLFESNPDFEPTSLSPTQVKNLQRKLFSSQINLAKKLDLPLLVHCRDDRSKNLRNSECWEEVLDLIKDHFGILHCYSGMMEITQKVLKMDGWLISFAGTLTYPKNDYLREAAKVLPLEKIVLETDSPFLPPQGKRGQRNEPLAVLEIAQLLVEIKGMSLEKVAQITTQNFKKLIN